MQTTLIRSDRSSTLKRVMDDAELNSRLIQALIDASASKIVVLDEDRMIVFANRAWRQFAALSGALATTHGIGKQYPDLFSGIASASSDDTFALRSGVKSVIEGEEIEFRIKYRCTALASPQWTLMHAAAIPSFNSTGRRLILVTHDEASEVESSLDEMRMDGKRLQQILNTANMLPWEATAARMQFTYIGEQADDLLGYSKQQWLQEGFWASKLHPDDRERVVAKYVGGANTDQHFRCEYRMIAKEGRVVWIEDMVDVLRTGDRPSSLQGIMTDVSERKLSESALIQLSGRLITAQEEERKRIARELHDDLNQRIALIAIELEQVVQKSSEGTSYALPVRLSAIQRQVAEISNEIHRMSYELHPSKLDHLGLVPALNSFCTDLSRSKGIRVIFKNRSVPGELSRDAKLCIFRIAQEALQNAAKHSGSPTVQVWLRGLNSTLELEITDYGNGFVADNEKLRKGLGLTSMKERIRLVGGELEITSTQGYGTRVSATVPLHSVGVRQNSVQNN